MLYGVSLAYKESANVRAASKDMQALFTSRVDVCILNGWPRICVTVPIGGELWASARAGHDPTYDAEELFAQGLA